MFLELITAPTTADTQPFIDCLVGFNNLQAPPENHSRFAYLLKVNDDLKGGILAYTHWNWLFIQGLWVHQDLRGQGQGSRLLREAEKLALSRGVANAWLDTFDFQARPFYEKHGYTCFATLENFPSGHRRFFMKKENFSLLDPETPTP